MSDDLVFDRAVAQLLAAERHVDRHIAAYADRDDLAGTQLLLETLRMVIEDALREVLTRQRSLAGASLAAGARERELRQIKSAARRTALLVGQPLHYVVKSHGRAFDPLAIAFGRMARQIAPNTELIFRGSENRGYALSPSLLEGLRQSLVNRGSPFVDQLERLPTLLYVQYPAVAEGDVLQHLLVAHEVAHLALRRPDGKKKRSQAEGRFETAIAAWRNADPQAHKAAEGIHASQTSDIWKARREKALYWFTELACDLLAVRLVGPAYYLALFEFALTRQWFYRADDDGSHTHPHLAWRLARAETQLSAFFQHMAPPLQSQVKAAFTSRIKAVPSAAATIKQEPYAAVIDIALDTLAEDLARSPADVLGNAPLDPALLATELRFVIEGLDNGLAPAERLCWSPHDVVTWDQDSADRPPRWSEPLDWRSVLNGGYISVLGTTKLPVEPLREKWLAEDRQRQDGTSRVRGTVELTEFHRRASVASGHLRTLDRRSSS
ncbi:MAG: hypothetical protein QOE65_1158 [Solirubrobacteraceae bacterium]|jgi:hypothetical protein|nr:hypothetical protein [Solirubrobacteraceae bacterium]